MLNSHLSPLRRLRSVMSRCAVVAVLVSATACTLNNSPDAQAVISGVPVVRLASPLPNATYLQGVGVNIQGYVSNAGPDIDRVEITVDSAIETSLPTPNTAGAPVFSVTHTWTAEVGTHVIGMTAFRADGSSSAPVTVSINVISPAGNADATEAVEPSPVPTQTPAPEGEGGEDGGEGGEDGGEGGEGGDEEPDEPEASETPSNPVATFNQGVNVRRGPGTNFVPPIGSFAAGQTADITGVNPAGDWYKVRYYNADGWVFASLLSVSGDTEDIPVDIGPPTPVPATATPIPPTAVPVTSTPVSSANLVAGQIRLDVDDPVCGETFNVRVDIANLGTSDTTATGTFTIRDTAGGNTAEAQGPIGIIRAGDTDESPPIPITINTNFDEEHTLVVILNPSGGIPETNSNDNRSPEFKYELEQGDC